jgi:pyruvate dehydrogenase E2 component (dihydrolipoamide acetyltransferase)
MASEITIPRLGWNMEEGTFVGWLKADGELVKAGDPLFNLEGDKATQEIESLESGILRIPPDSPKDGEKVAVGAVVGYLVAPDEPAPFVSQRNSPPATATAPPVREMPPQAAAAGRPFASGPPSLTTRGHKHAISPRARRAARQLGIDASVLSGSGKTGRIIERDVRAAAQRHPVRVPLDASGQARPLNAGREAGSPEFEEVSLSSIRQTIAERMLDSRQTTAAVTITTTVDATNLVNLRRQFKAAAETGETSPIGYTEIIVKLLAVALEKHPMLNSRWRAEHIQVWRSIHIGIAVDTEAGLIVPVIRDVSRLSLSELAGTARALLERARTRKLTASELSGSTFTLSNLGQLGIEAFTPLINPPECAILGLGRIHSQVVVLDKQFVERDRLFLSLTFDHRIVDGAPAARFLQTLCRLIENPSPWLLR